MSTLLPVFILGIFAVSAVITGRPDVNAKANEAAAIQIVNDDDVALIPTPARAVARGERIENVPIAIVKWPKSRITSEYVSDTESYRSSVTLTPLPKLLPIPISALSAAASDNNQVTESIPAGMRAITVRVDAESAVEGWAQSGNHVDVLLVRASREHEASLETRLIAENIKILSAGRSAEPTAAEQSAPKLPSTVTLLTSQDDALKIKTAANLGKLTFALRGVGDQLPASATSLDQRSLLGNAKPVSLKKYFKGKARGTDGKTYVLDDDSHWLETAADESPTKELPFGAKKSPEAE